MTTESAPVADVEEYLKQHEQKELLRFVAVGSVDDGKSTLIGRLLHDTRGVYEDQLSAIKRASKHSSAAGEIDFALLTDGLKAEREQGITIDVAYRYFSTAKRKFIIADTPGHVQYTRNMATGASTADVALILIDARNGVMTQSRRHAYIASLLGIPRLLVCVNKMDLVNFSEERFHAIRNEFLKLSEGLSFTEIEFFPISAVDGDNIVTRSKRSEWYGGSTLLQYLETTSLDRDGGQPAALRLPIQYVLRPHLNYRAFCGQLAAGSLSVDDEVVVMPSGRSTRVAGLDSYDGELDHAFAPMSVTVRLADEVDVSRGDMIVRADDVPTATRRIEADVVWMSEAPLDSQRSYLVKHTSRIARAHVIDIHGCVDLTTLEEVPAESLKLNDIGRVTFATNRDLLVDPYTSNRVTGAFVIIDALTNATVGAAMIRRALNVDNSRRNGADPRATRPSARADRLGHRALLVAHSDDASAAEQEAASYALEAALTDAGMLATVINIDRFDDGSRSSDLIADLVEATMQTGALVILSRSITRSAARDAIESRMGDNVLWLGGSDPATQLRTVLARANQA